MQVVYLDQNKWIELARAVKRPDDYPNLQSLPGRLRQEVDAGRLRLPLTFSNIYETHKINNPERRADLAFMQAFLSRGFVFRGRLLRRQLEIRQTIAKLLEIALDPPDGDWFLSTVFFEGAAEWGAFGQHVGISERFIEFIRAKPAESLYAYLIRTPDDVRTAAVRRFSAGSERLRAMVEDRRERHANEPLSMRRKIYSALMMIEDIDLILAQAGNVGAAWKQVADIGSSNARRIMNDVPAYYIEREIAVRLEAQNRPIEENDFRDMQSFCAVIPYANLVIGENQFVSLARQAGLDQKYGTRLATNLSALVETVDGWSSSS
ncbi:hypothetical protein [Mesorhizobium sp. M0047]|uniref:hypothetical protein n=1 Tax=Mesorhizobium sp. M0047 TaxID=2956859 RepID=UPI003338B81A